MVRDRAGNLYTPDANAGSIRVLKPDGSVDTFVGGTNTGQVLDGTGRGARLTSPHAITIDAEDNLYFADAGYVIRKASPSGVVTTIAGMLNQYGYRDGPGKQAWFSTVKAMAVDPSGNLFIGDDANDVIRKVTPSGIVSTVAGVPGVRGMRAGPLPGSIFSPSAMTVTAAGDLLVSSGSGIAQITAP
jgi:hypothetical protein